MSSHHIVREKQEPALVILGLNNFSFEQLGQLLEWSPTVIAAPLIAEELNSLGLKIDWIIGNNNDGIFQADVKNIAAEDGKVIDGALKFLIANGYPSVNIITDDFKIADYESYVEQINIVIFHDHRKIYTISSTFNKWKPSGEKIELLANSDNLRFDGLKKIGPFTYITTSDGFFTIHHNGKLLFIAEEN